MRVLSRVLLGTLAIVFAMVFLARLVGRRGLTRRKYSRPVRLPALEAGQAKKPAPEAGPADRFLASYPGGSAWGPPLIVPPSSSSGVLRRRIRRARLALRYAGGRRGAPLRFRKRYARRLARARCKKPWVA
jgi:hypothetical protein